MCRLGTKKLCMYECIYEAHYILAGEYRHQSAVSQAYQQQLLYSSSWDAARKLLD